MTFSVVASAESCADAAYVHICLWLCVTSLLANAHRVFKTHQIKPGLFFSKVSARLSNLSRIIFYLNEKKTTN